MTSYMIYRKYISPLKNGTILKSESKLLHYKHLRKDCPMLSFLYICRLWLIYTDLGGVEGCTVSRGDATAK